MSTAVEPVETTLAVVEPGQRAGVYALGAQTDAQFTENLTVLKRGLARLDAVIQEVMQKGVDYDEPQYLQRQGQSPKKNLLLPGAEKLAFMARLVPSYHWQRTVGMHENEPAVHYALHCNLHQGSLDGAIVAQGVGSANSHEAKYRYRKGERHCPECGSIGTVFRSKFIDEQTGEKGWYCYDKKGGCGAQFDAGDKRITEQQVDRVENPDPFDLDNTLLKMAKTRAFRDAIKSATGGSARLTQDVEDLGTRRPATDGRVVNRDELVTSVYAAAKAAGMTKIGDILARAAALLSIPETRKLEKIADLETSELSLLLEDMEGSDADA